MTPPPGWLLLVGFLAGLGANAWCQEAKDTVTLRMVTIESAKPFKKRNQGDYPIDSTTLAHSRSSRLSELIAQNTPVFIKEYGRGAMATASFRGTAPSHTRVTWNGLDLNSPMLGMVDFSLVPVNFTDQVILRPGASSLAQTAGALGGSIQLENHADWSRASSGKIMAAAGSYRTFDEYLQLLTGNRNFQSKSSVYCNSSANDFPFVNKMNATIDPASGNYTYNKDRNRDAGYLNYGLLQEFYLRGGNSTEFSWKTWLQHNDRSIPQLLTNESAEGSNLNRQQENSLRSVAEWRHTGLQSQWTLMTALNIQNSLYRLENSIAGAGSLTVMNAEANLASYSGKAGYFSQLNGWLTMTGTAEFSIHRVNSQNHLLLDRSEGYFRTRNEFGLSGTLSARILPDWHAELLVRGMAVGSDYLALLPRGMIRWHPGTGNGPVLNISMALNTHPPTLNDLYYMPGGNPGLKAEQGLQYDAGFTQDFHPGQAVVHLGLSLFRSGIRNWIIWLPSFQGYWEPSNLEKVTSSGLEANAKASTRIGSFQAELSGNYAFTRTLNRVPGSEAYGKQLPYIPEHSANLVLHLSRGRAYADWLWTWYSKRYTTTANNAETISDYLYPYLMNNLRAGKSFPAGKHTLSAECMVMNLFNEEYRTVLQRPMPGRNYQLILRYEF